MNAAGIEDVFRPFGPVRCKRMFGGHGVYVGDVMIAIEADGEIFLKADALTADAFEAEGSQPFSYDKGGKATVMSYWRLPEAALDDPDEMKRWGELALAAARRAAAGKIRRPAGGLKKAR